MAEFPALPLWTDAWVADTHHLGIFARGLYHDLLVLMWRTPGCRVPADAAWLMTRLRISQAEFDNVLKQLLNELCQRNAGWYMQKRLTREYEWVKANRAAQSERAKRRWEKEKGICRGNAPTPTPTPLKKEDKKVRATRWHPEAAITDEWLSHALVARRRNQLPDIDLALEAERFVNFWASKSGANATKLDWHKTWINWILKAEGQRNGHARPTANAKFLEGTKAFLDSLQGPSEGESLGADADAVGLPLLPS